MNEGDRTGGNANEVDRTRGIVGGALVLMLTQAGSIVITLLLTPFMVNQLGLERYGLWVFLFAVVAFAGLLEVSVGRGSVRFIAFYGERGELDVVRRIVSYGALTRIALGLVLCPLAWLAGKALLPHANIPGSLVDDAQTLLPFVLGYFFLSATTRLMAALVIAFERTWLVALITFASQVLYAGLVVLFLLEGLELPGLLLAISAQSVAQGLACYVVARRLIGSVFGNPLALERRVVIELLKFGGWTQLTNLSTLVNRQVDAVLIGSFIAIDTVGLYDLGNKIAQVARTLPLTLLGPLLPAASRIHAQRDRQRIARTILQGSRLLALVTFGIGGFFVATAALIMTVWLGQSYRDVTTIAVLLTLTFAVNNLTGVGTTIVAAIGSPRYESEYAIAGMVLNVAATAVLGAIFGLYGIIAGTVFGITTSSIYFIWRFHNLLELPIGEYLFSWLWRLGTATAVASAATYGVRMAFPDSMVDGRGNGLAVLVLLALFYAVLLVAGLRVFNFLQRRDLETIQRILPDRLQHLTRLSAVEFLFGTRLTGAAVPAEPPPAPGPHRGP
jgi:O-antigen/teichoic acid export membrane protein